jgi:hypothetical protein
VRCVVLTGCVVCGWKTLLFIRFDSLRSTSQHLSHNTTTDS